MNVKDIEQLINSLKFKICIAPIDIDVDKLIKSVLSTKSWSYHAKK